MSTEYVTVIGHRNIPDLYFNKLEKIAKILGDRFIVRSGGAGGADTAAMAAFNKQIYIPWNGFNNLHHDGFEVLSLDKMPNSDAAYNILKRYNSSRSWVGYVKSLHTRNVYQVLGTDLATPSKMVVCYAERCNTITQHVTGGTATAVSIAIQLGIPIINIKYDNRFDSVIS